MRTFAQKPKTTQQTTSAKPTISRRAHFGQSPEVRLILRLQRTLGNQAVQRMLQTHAEEPEARSAAAVSPRFVHDFSRIPVHAQVPVNIQPKLAINTPADLYEQEAERIAEHVMRMPEPQLQGACADGGTGPTCQTKQPDQAPDRLQTKPIGSSDLGQTAVPPIVDEVLSLPGQPLDTATRSLMGPRFGRDFSSVRVHTDSLAARSAESVGAQAYTVGRDVVFGAGRYAPASRDGQRLLAHELTHVVQQGGSGVPPSLSRDEAPSKTVETGERPQVLARGPVRLAAQPDPGKAGAWPRMGGPMELVGGKPDPLEDRRLGLRIVDPAEIEANARWILSMPGGWVAAQCKADFKSSPRLARANLEHSHWRNDNERLLYARFYFEQFMGAGGERIDSEEIVQALVNYEIQLQRPSADFVVHNPVTADDQAKLEALRKPRRAEAEKRGKFEGPLAKARAEFFSNQDFSVLHMSQLFQPAQLTWAADAVVAATRDFTNTVPLKFFEYYSDHLLMKMDADDEKNAWRRDYYALTDPGGNTRLRSDVIAFPKGILGPILIHELGHTQDVENAVGLGDFQEGHGYAVEYFFSNDQVRKDKILEILSGDSIVMVSEKPKLRRLFQETLASLIALDEVIKHGSSPHLPAQIAPDAERARQLMAERVERSRPGSDQLKAITQYVYGHLDPFNLPVI